MLINEELSNEMAIKPVSTKADNLPFRIVIKTPDHLPPHAHVLDLKTGKIDIYQFLLKENSPKAPADIKDYKGTLSDEQKQLICDWANRRNRKFPKFTNWELLLANWLPNEGW